jgi:hypothetical protein
MAGKIASLVVDLRADVAQFRTGMDQAGRSLAGLNSSVNTAKTAVASLFTLFAAREIAGFITQSLDAATVIGDTARRLGLTSEKFQEYSFAARQAGIDQELLTTGLGILAKNLGLAQAGSKTAAVGFERLGISQAQLKGKDLAATIALVSDKLAGLGDASARAAVLSELAGRGGIALGNFFAEGSKGLDAAAARARELGAVLSNETIASAKQAKDDLAALSTVIKVQLTEALVAVLPKLTPFTDKLAEMAKAAGEVFERFAPLDLASWGELSARIGAAQLALKALNAEREKAKEAGFAGLLLGGRGVGTINLDIERARDELKSFLAEEDKRLKSGKLEPTLTKPVSTSPPIFDPEAIAAAEKATALFQKTADSLQFETDKQIALHAALLDGKDATDAVAGSVELYNALEKAGVDITSARGAEIERLVIGLHNEKLGTDALTEALKIQHIEEGKRAVKLVAENQKRADLAVPLIEQVGLPPDSAKGLKEFESAMQGLGDQLQAGAIDWDTYNQAEQLALKDLKKNVDPAKGAVEDLGKAVLEAGNLITSSFIDAIISLKDADAVLIALGQDIGKVILQAIIVKPLLRELDALTAPGGGLNDIFSKALSGIGSWFGFGASAAPSGIPTTAQMFPPVPHAQGGIFPAAISPAQLMAPLRAMTLLPRLASGAVIHSPHYLPMAGGQALMGERGSEAVLPLGRTPSGDLGVKVIGGGTGGGVVVNVQVINNTNSQVQTQQRQNGNGIDLRIIVNEAVAENIRSGGTVARAITSMTGASQRPFQR